MRVALVIVAMLGVLAGTVQSVAGPPSNSPYQKAPSPAFVTAPNMDGIGDDPKACTWLYDRSLNCLNTLAAGDVIVTLSWPTQSCPQADCGRASKFTIYRVPASLVVRASTLQPAPLATLAPGPVRPPTVVKGPAPATTIPKPQVNVMPRAQMPAPDHVVVANGSLNPAEWAPGVTAAFIAKPKLGDCFVARASTEDGAQSGDSNKVCIDANVKFGTEAITFNAVKSNGFWHLINPSKCRLNPSFTTDMPNTAGTSATGLVGWQTWSTDVKGYGDDHSLCTATQVFQTASDFDLGETKLPIIKAELWTSGDAKCIGEYGVGFVTNDLGSLKQTVPSQFNFDQDVTSMVTASKLTFVFAPNPSGAAMMAKGCQSALSGSWLKVTRLK